MNEQWEICIVSKVYLYKKTFSPRDSGRPKVTDFEFDVDVDRAIIGLLSDGWQPYAVIEESSNPALYFRRSIS